MACGYAEMNGMGLINLFIHNARVLVTKAHNHASKKWFINSNYGLDHFVFCWGAQATGAACLGRLPYQQEHSMLLYPLS